MNQSMKREIITRTAESEVTNGSVQGESRLANDIEPPAGPWRWAKLLSFFFWLRVLPCVFRYCREFLCLRYSKLKMQKKKRFVFSFLFVASSSFGRFRADRRRPGNPVDGDGDVDAVECVLSQGRSFRRPKWSPIPNQGPYKQSLTRYNPVLPALSRIKPSRTQ